MGRVKYRGQDSGTTGRTKTTGTQNNNNTSNNNHHHNNNNNINNNNYDKDLKSNGLNAVNGKPPRNGSSKRRSKNPPSSSEQSSSLLRNNSVLLVLLIVFTSTTVALWNHRHFLASFTYHDGDASPTARRGPGGWRRASEDVLQKYDPGRCSVERISVSDLSPERFESEVRFQKPVLVTFPGGASDWTDPEKWSRDDLVKEYSNWTIRSGESLEIVRKGGNAKHTSSFLTFVDELLGAGNERPQNYVFDRRFYWHSKLPDTLKLPDYFKVNRSLDDSIFFLGSSMTGVVFHKHSDTWNGVVYGRKRWFLYPSKHTPPGGVHHGYTILEWVNRVYPNLTEVDQPMECVQEPGEILYLPEGTYHATLNLGDTIAVAIQKTDAKLKTEILFYEATNLINLIQDKPPKNPGDPRNIRLLEVYRQLNELLPDNAEVMAKIGERLYEMEEYTESLTWHLMTIKKEPYFILAYIHLGMTYSKLRLYDEAEEQFLKALELSPNFWDIHKEYGEFLFRRGRVADALQIYKKGTELRPDLVPFWYFYKVCQEQVGDVEGAKVTSKIIDELTADEESES